MTRQSFPPMQLRERLALMRVAAAEEEEGDHHSKAGLMGTSTKGTLLIIIRVW